MAEGLAAGSEFMDAWVKVFGRSDVTLHAVSIFLLIAREAPRPVPQLSIVNRTGLSEAAISRNLGVLSVGSVQQPGPQLIETYADPDNPRRNVVALTAKGRRFAETLTDILQKAGGKHGAAPSR